MVVCVVSAYYNISSKLATKEFIETMDTFFTNCSFNLVLFTESDCLPLFSKWRATWKDRTILVTWPLEQFSSLEKVSAEAWEQQKKKDPDQVSTPSLYQIYFEKKEFVLRAIQMNAFRAETFVWCDAGILKLPTWLPPIKEKFPDEKRVVPNSITLLQITDFQEAETPWTDYSKIDRVSGAIQAADKDTWIWWSAQYDAMVKKYVKNDLFFGKDHSILASLCKLFPERITLVKPPKGVDPPSLWLLPYLSGF